jgi:hypothetical protein
VLLAQVVAVRLGVRGQRAEHRRRVTVHIRQRVHGRMLACGARAATRTHPAHLAHITVTIECPEPRDRVGYNGDGIRPRTVTPSPSAGAVLVSCSVRNPEVRVVRSRGSFAAPSRLLHGSFKAPSRLLRGSAACGDGGTWVGFASRRGGRAPNQWVRHRNGKSHLGLTIEATVAGDRLGPPVHVTAVTRRRCRHARRRSSPVTAEDPASADTLGNPSCPDHPQRPDPPR